MAIAQRNFSDQINDSQDTLGFLRVSRAKDDFEPPDREEHWSVLMQTIEREIIPRLLLVRGSGDLVGTLGEDRWLIGKDFVEFYTNEILSKSVPDCVAHVERMRADGIPLQSVFLDLFAPTARRLGELWNQDRRSFTDVTIALGTLQQVFRHFAPMAVADPLGPPTRRALLVPAPGEQHNFGLFILETCFHRAGWRVDAMPHFDQAAVRRYLRNNTGMNLIGISASCDRFLQETSAAIDMMRNEAHDDAYRVMVGGGPFSSVPALAAEVGADATATDAAKAVETAERLIPISGGEPNRRRIN